MPDNQVGTEREEVAEPFRDGACYAGVVFYGMPAVHGPEYSVAAALHGHVDEPVQAFVGKAVQERFQVRCHVPRVAHAQANLVVSRNVR